MYSARHIVGDPCDARGAGWLRPDLRWLVIAAAFCLSIVAAGDASAQLRNTIGNAGASVGGAVGATPGGGSQGAGIDWIGTGVRVPTGDAGLPALPRPDAANTLQRPVDNVTNTISGATGNALSIPGGVVGGLGNTINQAGRNAPGAAGQRRSGVPPIGERRFVPDEVMLRLPGNLSAQALDDLSRRHGLTRLESQAVGLTGSTFHRWRITGGRSVSDVIRALEAESGVSAAQPNYRFTLAQQSQPQGSAAEQPTQYALAKLSLPQAHHLATGDKILVAVIDSGIDASHPELEGLIAGSFDPLNSNEAPHSHGTGMAGAIVAHAKLTGVAPAARILAIRAFGQAGKTAESTTLTLLRSIDWAVGNGARVINMSFAGPADPEIARALAAARKKGVVLVAAAGNAGPKAAPLFPASDASVIAVTATDAEDKLLGVANRGKHIAVAAPGVEILAAAPGGTYQVTTGTSVAAAHVSGLAALLLERKPDLTPDALKKALLSTATDLGPKGRDDQFGAGLANAYRAIRALDTQPPRAVSANARPAR